MSCEMNKPNITYYVTLDSYTKDRFGNTNFNPPLSQPIEKTITYEMNNYNSLSKNTSQTGYTEFKNAYNPPTYEICSKYN